ncbi:MAG: hypothetical protein JHC31_15020 [Sulfurihydrogenibium sp.]|jgi:hypothetical protein|nr:hypothetical protein [Sulfurihydrogenibium sp.]
MKRVNLAVLNFPWIRTKEKSKVEFWSVWWDENYEDLVGREEFEFGTEFYLGCFRVWVHENYLKITSKKFFIDKVVIKYKECKLKIELYQENNLIESFEVEDFSNIEKYNVHLIVSKF